MKSALLIGLCLLPLTLLAEEAPVVSAGAPKIQAFGEGGQIKMLYDRRQRPSGKSLSTS